MTVKFHSVFLLFILSPHAATPYYNPSFQGDDHAICWRSNHIAHSIMQGYLAAFDHSHFKASSMHGTPHLGPFFHRYYGTLLTTQ